MLPEKEALCLLPYMVQEPQTTEDIRYTDFFHTLPYWYESENIDIYGSEMRYLNRFGHLDSKILTVMERFNDVNRHIASYAANHFGSDAPMTAATAILSELTPLVNTLFYENVQYNKRNTQPSPSWQTTSEESVHSIQRKVTSICGRPRYKAYFHSSPEAAEIFDMFAYKIPNLTETNEQVNAFAHIDILSKRLYNRGLPVFIVPHSEYYSSIPKYSSRPIVPEATLRLMVRTAPPPSKDNGNMEQMIWNHLRELHPTAVHQKQPDVLFGNWVMSAGSDIVSLTIAERLSKDTIIILSNAYKHHALVEAAAKLTNTPMTQGDIQRMLMFVYVAHEFGHFYYDVADGRYFEELDTDLTMLHEVLIHGQSCGFSSAQLVCFLLGDYARQAMQTETISVTSDGYRKSGIHMIEKLLDSGYVSIENDCISIGEGQLDKSVLTDHKAIHDQNLEALDALQTKELSEKGRRIAELILASHI